MKFIKDFSRGTRAADVNRPRKPRTQIAGGCMEEKIRLEMRKIADLIPYEHNAKLHLSEVLGITPDARRTRGLLLPNP